MVENATYLEKYLKKIGLGENLCYLFGKGIFKKFGLGENVCYLFGKVSSKHLDLGKMYAIYLEWYLQNIMDLIGGNATHSQRYLQKMSFDLWE